MTNSKGLPKDIADNLELISKELSYSHLKWNIFCQLYATDQNRIELLNGTASVFFWVVQDSLIRDVILSITRLTDPEKSRGKDNLSLKQLCSQLNKENRFFDLVDILSKNLEKIDESKTSFKEIRDKFISHNDLGFAKKEIYPFSEISKININQILALIDQYINTIYLYFGLDDANFAYVVAYSDGEALISILQDYWDNYNNKS